MGRSRTAVLDQIDLIDLDSRFRLLAQAVELATVRSLDAATGGTATEQAVALAGRPARLGRLRRSPCLVRGVVDAELLPIPARRRSYHPTAVGMATVAELVLAPLTADHGSPAYIGPSR